MAAGAAAGRDARVRCCSRRGLERLLGLCAPFLRALAAGQPGGPAEDDVLWVRRPGRGWGAGEGGREGPAGGASPPRGCFRDVALRDGDLIPDAIPGSIPGQWVRKRLKQLQEFCSL